MLEGLRKAQQNWLGKIIITILFSILILSFAMVFVQSYLVRTPENTVITAGKTTVSADAVSSAFQDVMAQQSRAANRQISPKEARAMQLDQQALAQLVSMAVLDENTRKLGLAVSDEMVRNYILALPRFQSALGFDRPAFDSYLRDRNMSEGAFIDEQRAAMMREQLGSALALGLTVPQPMQELAFRLANEKRDASYFVLTEANVGDIPAPTKDQLEATYQDNKGQFRAPEYRSFEAISVLPENIAKPADVSDEDARKAYETLKATRYPEVERRTIQQISFANAKEAEDALARLKAGKVTYDALATEHKVAPESLTIGTLTRQEVLDAAVAEAAFSLPQGQYSDVVTSRFGPLILRVTKVGPSSFNDFKDEIKGLIANERAARLASDLRDDIEDMTANARPFAEIAKEKNLQLVEVKAVDQAGLDLNGKAVEGVPDKQRLLQAVFNAEIGSDNASLQTPDGGYVWYHVTNITPSRDRSLEEIQPQIAEIWKGNEINTRLAKQAADHVAQIKTADDLKKVAAAAKANVKTLQKQGRTGTPPADFGTDGFQRLFATPVGTPASVANGQNRVVFLVNAADVPAFNDQSNEVKLLTTRLGQDLGLDLITSYIGNEQKHLGVTVDQNVARRVFNPGSGGEN